MKELALAHFSLRNVRAGVCLLETSLNGVSLSTGVLEMKEREFVAADNTFSCKRAGTHSFGEN